MRFKAEVGESKQGSASRSRLIFLIGSPFLVLGRWPTDFTSTYQMLLVAKIAFVAGMTGLALMNRYIFVPRTLTQPDRAIIQIRNGTYAELALGAGVLALVAFLGILDPV